MTRVVMIGIDGLDADLLRVYGPSLPHLRRLMLESPFLELKSCFPPETTAAWASIYTGLNPANHGVLDWGNYAHVRSQEPPASPSPKLKIPSGETFWDIAGQAGRRVCVVNPLLAYPAWSVNGVMLSLPPAELHLSQGDKTFPCLPASPIIPSPHQLKDFCDSLHTLTWQQAERGLELYRREPWDIFFLQLDALDHIQHYLWRYSDPGDPTYPGRNKHSGCILEFYRLFDTIIGRFRTLLEHDSVLAVVSGHGHGRRCLQYLNLNEWLRNQNWLTARTKSMRLLDRRYMVERAKHRSLELLTQLRLQNVMPHFPQYFPDRLAFGQAACLIDQQETMAQVAELAGASPFGGILLNRACIERRGHGYEHVRKTLLQRLLQLRLKGRPAVNWAESRENVYQGKYIEYYPDILFELRNEFGVSSSIYTPLTSNNLAHQAISGDHRMHGVVLLGNLPSEVQIPEDSREPTVLDVAPTVLRLIEVTCTNRDGEALVLPQAAPAMLPRS